MGYYDDGAQEDSPIEHAIHATAAVRRNQQSIPGKDFRKFSSNTSDRATLTLSGHTLQTSLQEPLLEGQSIKHFVIRATFKQGLKELPVRVLLDTGATSLFIDRKFADKHFKKSKLAQSEKLSVIDGSEV
jgi:hypothetical protein